MTPHAEAGTPWLALDCVEVLNQTLNVSKETTQPVKATSSSVFEIYD